MENIITNFLFKKIKRFMSLLEEYNRKEELKKYGRLGDNVSMQAPFCHTSPEKITIGNNVSFAAYVHIWGGGGVEIGNDCMIASHCAITSITHNPKQKKFNSENVFAPVKIGNNVWIGAHCVILPGVTIGDNVVVGAGSIVNKNLKDNGVYVGTPCKLLYELDNEE